VQGFKDKRIQERQAHETTRTNQSIAVAIL
jgi:hypothetical protein